MRIYFIDNYCMHMFHIALYINNLKLATRLKLLATMVSIATVCLVLFYCLL